MSRDPDTAIVATPISAPETALHREAATILDVIAKAARDPSVDVGKLERLLAIQQQLLADQRRTSFRAALSDLEARLPQIAKSGHVIVNGQLRSKFARIEDVDSAIRPLCTEHGFAFAFDSKPVPSGIEYSCTMSHRDGHAETRSITLPADTGPGRNAVQSIGSTTSYARRYLLAMHLHLVTRDEDDDANGGRGAPVTPDQAKALREALATVGGNESRFLNWLAAPSFEEIPGANYERAMRFIEEKGRAK